MFDSVIPRVEISGRGNLSSKKEAATGTSFACVPAVNTRESSIERTPPGRRLGVTDTRNSTCCPGLTVACCGSSPSWRRSLSRRAYPTLSSGVLRLRPARSSTGFGRPHSPRRPGFPASRQAISTTWWWKRRVGAGALPNTVLKNRVEESPTCVDRTP